MVGIIQLFEDKIEYEERDPSQYYDIEALQELADEIGIKINPEVQKQDRMDIYYDLIFSFMDEINGLFYHARPRSLIYSNSPDINEDEFSESNSNQVVNPARKSTRPVPVYRIIPAIYNLLNGKHFAFYAGSKPGDLKNLHLIGCYPYLPWLGSGKEHTLHSVPFDDEIKDIALLYSDDISKRQELLCMEYKLTEIPVNCIEEFLNPDVFLNLFILLLPAGKLVGSSLQSLSLYLRVQAF